MAIPLDRWYDLLTAGVPQAAFRRRRRGLLVFSKPRTSPRMPASKPISVVRSAMIFKVARLHSCPPALYFHAAQNLQGAARG